MMQGIEVTELRNFKLSVVIPCYNELGTIEIVIKTVKASPVANLEIIVVNDCSTDGTTELLKSKLEPQVDRVLDHATNRGKGAALRTGFAAVTG